MKKKFYAISFLIKLNVVKANVTSLNVKCIEIRFVSFFSFYKFITIKMFLSKSHESVYGSYRAKQKFLDDLTPTITSNKISFLLIFKFFFYHYGF